jgi:hypothetical protein
VNPSAQLHDKKNAGIQIYRTPRWIGAVDVASSRHVCSKICRAALQTAGLPYTCACRYAAARQQAPRHCDSAPRCSEASRPPWPLPSLLRPVSAICTRKRERERERERERKRGGGGGRWIEPFLAPTTAVDNVSTQNI